MENTPVQLNTAERVTEQVAETGFWISEFRKSENVGKNLGHADSLVMARYDSSPDSWLATEPQKMTLLQAYN